MAKNMTMTKKIDLIERLDNFRITNDDETCYGWSGAKCNRGLPRIFFEGSSIGANRATWMAYFGKIPSFRYVKQTCGNKLCTNPEHLFLSKEKGPDLKKMERDPVRQERKRLGIDLPPKQVAGIKKNAHKRNMTITKYMSLLIGRALELERSYEIQESE